MEKKGAAFCGVQALFFVILGIGLGLAEYFKNMAYEAMKQTAAMNLRKQLFSSLMKQEIGAENALPLFPRSHFDALKTIFLPRQARDKYRKS